MILICHLRIIRIYLPSAKCECESFSFRFAFSAQKMTALSWPQNCMAIFVPVLGFFHAYAILSYGAKLARFLMRIFSLTALSRIDSAVMASDWVNENHSTFVTIFIFFENQSLMTENRHSFNGENFLHWTSATALVNWELWRYATQHFNH